MIDMVISFYISEATMLASQPPRTYIKAKKNMGMIRCTRQLPPLAAPAKSITHQHQIKVISLPIWDRQTSVESGIQG
jgi:hypothetical protein